MVQSFSSVCSGRIDGNRLRATGVLQFSGCALDDRGLLPRRCLLPRRHGDGQPFEKKVARLGVLFHFAEPPEPPGLVVDEPRGERGFLRFAAEEMCQKRGFDPGQSPVGDEDEPHAFQQEIDARRAPPTESFHGLPERHGGAEA